MKFTLEVDLDQLNPERTADELSRILRYWGGNVKHYELKAGDREKIFDSGYAKVGRWAIIEDEAAELASSQASNEASNQVSSQVSSQSSNQVSTPGFASGESAAAG